MEYVVDIDGTICSLTERQYHLAQPFEKRIKKINSLYDDGHTIIYATARGMKTFNYDIERCYNELYELTKKQLDSWGAKHHKLFLGKPPGDLYIDDKGVQCEIYFSEEGEHK